MTLTNAEVLEVPCIRCNAGVGEGCTDKAFSGTEGLLIRGFHKERVQLRERYPSFPKEQDLNATDKALITYYSYVMLCDSVSAHSVRLMGKQFTSQEIQRMFCRKAIEELIKDGLLGEPVATQSSTESPQ